MPSANILCTILETTYGVNGLQTDALYIGWAVDRALDMPDTHNLFDVKIAQEAESKAVAPGQNAVRPRLRSPPVLITYDKHAV